MKPVYLPGREYQERPWGFFERFTHGEVSTVKIIVVREGEELSLQSHERRDEFWRIVNGEGAVTIGDETITAHAGDEFFIPRMTKHRAGGGATHDLEILEIAFGDFDENDIIRYEDKYNRE